MKQAQYDKLSVNNRIGLKPLGCSTSNSNDKPEYFIDELPKRLTKTNSFMIIDEVFIIRKKDYLGKASKLYHVFRKSDGRLVCSVPRDTREEVIALVMRKYKG